MATRYEYIGGKLSWVKVHAPNQWSKWTCTIHPTPESLEKVRDMQAEGLKNVIKKDDDGYYCSFSRPTSTVIQGKVRGYAPPKLLDKDGVETPNVNVGNGSDGVVKLEVYSHKTPGGGTAIAARLDSIRIDNLIPFEGNRDFTPQEREQVEGLTEARSPLWH